MSATSSAVRGVASRRSGELEGIERLGVRLRDERVARGIGVRELARLVDCSASLISQIERDPANPSVSTLYAISNVLKLSLDALFGAQVPTGTSAAVQRQAALRPRGGALAPVVLRAPERRVINLERGVQWQLLMPVPEHDAEFMEVSYAPLGGSTADDHAICHNGREYSLVLEGTLQLDLGSEHFSLGPGDSMAFDSTIPHRLWNEGDVLVRAVWFVLDRLGTTPP